MVELGEMTEAKKSIENIKQSVLIIEGLFFGVNNSTVPLRFAEQVLKGMGFLNQMHNQLLGQLSPEEVEKMRAQNKTNIPPLPTSPPAPSKIINPNDPSIA